MVPIWTLDAIAYDKVMSILICNILARSLSQLLQNQASLSNLCSFCSTMK
ncbi:hypothetical protein I8751_08410 [Nostocaceae cyanobacterium CENA357]|uniref:Uncharacterized protein n=1 Tax=Atlanticothrix silvestris CENA357 TaxID=1725252 RepID=A0A8J7L4V1_9CYAN|nr:hypothetical protein [Atlanticothrix silvestris]MBH8552397.1 hypothetical protein [Atlanticothrix silvestris CENA357]